MFPVHVGGLLRCVDLLGAGVGDSSLSSSVGEGDLCSLLGGGHCGDLCGNGGV
jgi:hypothetical protein